MNLSLSKEADYIESQARRDRPAALRRLNVLLDRCKRLEGNDLDTAMSFNALLVTELRTRNLKLFTTYIPPENEWVQSLPVA